MTNPDTPAPPARPKPDSRDARLKAALKANLARRKAQARDRSGPEADTDGETARDEG
jgi:hypothetical protein